jgi:stage II sporulation protein AB (anti-sigma F factor)
MANKNLIKMTFPSSSENVGIARVTAARSLPRSWTYTLSDIEEIKVAVSEAISNAVIHGYGNKPGEIEFTLSLDEDRLEFVITDFGKGIRRHRASQTTVLFHRSGADGPGFRLHENRLWTN